jgi:hypothetical protein
METISVVRLLTRSCHDSYLREYHHTPPWSECHYQEQLPPGEGRWNVVVFHMLSKLMKRCLQAGTACTQGQILRSRREHLHRSFSQAPSHSFLIIQALPAQSFVCLSLSLHFQHILN